MFLLIHSDFAVAKIQLVTWFVDFKRNFRIVSVHINWKEGRFHLCPQTLFK